MLASSAGPAAACGATDGPKVATPLAVAVRVSFLAAAAFLAGMILFCGAVWVGALSGQSLGPIAPLGGMLLMLGWALLALAAARR